MTSWPDKAMHQTLAGRVTSLEARDVSVIRLRDSGADSFIQQPTGTAFTTKMMRILNPEQQVTRLLTEIWVQVPSGAALPAGVKARQYLGNPAPLPIDRVTIEQRDGATWLRLQVLATLLPADALWLDFAPAYPLLLNNTPATNSDQTLIVSLAPPRGDEIDGSVAGVRLVTSGRRNVLGQIAPDAFPTANQPSPNLTEGAVEMVLDDPPYLRTVLGGSEYQLHFTKTSGGGGEAT